MVEQIPSVIKDFIFFAHEKWRVASDKQGSSNTANIGSIKDVDDLLAGRGTFWVYFKDDGERWFDEYWMNYGKITIKTEDGKTKKVTSLVDFLKFKGINIDEIKKRR